MKHLKALTLSLLTLNWMLSPVTAAPVTTSTQAQARLSLIESDPQVKTETDPNRMIPFVEIRDEQGREREYSVPFAPTSKAKEVVADQTTSWQNYQDTMHWAMQVGVNTDISIVPPPGQTYTSRFMNCTLQVGANLEIAAGQKLSKKSWITRPTVKNMNALSLSTFAPSAQRAIQGVSQGKWASDGVDFSSAAVPLVQRTNYCNYSSNTFIPDYLTGYYTPAIRECTFFGCIQTSGYPKPQSINYSAIAARLRAACNAANANETKIYQKTNLTSLSQNLPLAIQWNGVMTPQGTKSGTTMSPVWADTQKDLQANTTSLSKIIQADSRNETYLQGKLPGANNPNPTAHQLGTPDLEAYKQYISPGNIQAQEEMGYASFFQTWQQADTVNDMRPIIYWATAMNCRYLACTPVPVPVTVPSVIVTSSAATHTCTTTNANTGTTSLLATRFHWGMVSIPEGNLIPNLTGSPILRPGNE